LVRSITTTSWHMDSKAMDFRLTFLFGIVLGSLIAIAFTAKAEEGPITVIETPNGEVMEVYKYTDTGNGAVCYYGQGFFSCVK